MDQLPKKCRRWQEFGLISFDQMSAIIAFERQRRHDSLSITFAKVGIFAILLGVLSLVASNWPVIPAWAKLFGHGILNATLALKIARSGDAKPLIRDLYVLVLFGLFLTFIALVGQIYQVHGDITDTLRFWWLISTPFLWWCGRSSLVAVPWLVLTLYVLYTSIDPFLADWFPNANLLVLQPWGYSSLSFALPLILVTASRHTTLQRWRAGYASVFYYASLAFTLPLVNAAIFYLYMEENVYRYTLVPAGFLVVCLFLGAWHFRTHQRQQTDKELGWYLLVSGLVILITLVLPAALRGQWASTFLFVSYWGFLAWLCTRLEEFSWANWTVRIIILRIFVVYLEVFGSMLTQGVGLIVSGLLLLLVLRYLPRLTVMFHKGIAYAKR
jgi:hypothetical protein